MLPMTKVGNCCQEQKMSWSSCDEVGNVYLLVVVDTRFCCSIAGGVRAEISKRVGWAAVTREWNTLIPLFSLFFSNLITYLTLRDV